MPQIKAFTSKLRQNKHEYYTLALVTLGLPLIACLYVDIKLAITVFVLTQSAIGILAMRNK